MSEPVTDSSTITFHQNSPRPPVVPGEETCGGVYSPAAGWGGRFGRGGSPVPTPRRSTLTHHEILPEGAAPLGFEPEGCSSPRAGGGAGEDRYSPPSCLRWARCLPSLLEDPDGVELFRRYLEGEGRSHADALDFWFACEGLRKQVDPDKISQLVRVIYRRYFLKTQLGIPEDLRKTVNRRIKDGTDLDSGVFNDSQREVERIITETTYPNFLRSDIYLSHVQAMQNASSCSGSGSGSSSGASSGGLMGPPPAMLATVHEDSELVEPPLPLPLTRDMLLVTQKRRATELRPKPEAYAGVYMQSVGKARMAYSSYNPVSRQDSELQSLSSDARTESDNMSLTDSSVDGTYNGHHRLSRKQYQRHCRQVKEAANLNRDLHVHHTFIPRTQRIQKEQVRPMEPDQFAAILIEKLENVRRDQEAQEILDRKLLEAETCSPADFSAAIQRSLSETIREKLQLEDDNVQDILDQHVSRVWSDLTPSRSPGLSSPRPKSPPHRRSAQPLSKVGCGSSLPSHVNMAPPHPYQSRPYPRYPRKDKDVFSTFSSDSGNVHDFAEGSEHRLHLPKSKSMPDYSDAYPQVPGHDSRLRQSRSKWSSKKTELTDSGVSVVSDTPPVSLASQFKDIRVLSWLLESGTATESRASHSHSDRDKDSSVASSHRRRSVSPPAPAQPFVADPSMPPLPSPHTATQLEEARRRLLEDENRKSRVRLGVCGSQSGGSTLRRPNGGGRGASGAPPPTTTPTATTNPTTTSTYTTVVFSFCDEQVPYRTKIPAKQVTLRQFKEYLPKKGSYRYFFKTECEDLDMKVIQEEITDDNDVLPLWEGKIMAQVKAAD